MSVSIGIWVMTPQNIHLTCLWRWCLSRKTKTEVVSRAQRRNQSPLFKMSSGLIWIASERSRSFARNNLWILVHCWTFKVVCRLLLVGRNMNDGIVEMHSNRIDSKPRNISTKQVIAACRTQACCFWSEVCRSRLCDIKTSCPTTYINQCVWPWTAEP